MWTFIVSFLKYPDKYPGRPVLYPSFLILVNEKWDLDDQSLWSLLEQHSTLLRMQREEEEKEAAAVWPHDPCCQHHLLSLGKSDQLHPFSQAIYYTPCLQRVVAGGRYFSMLCSPKESSWGSPDLCWLLVRVRAPMACFGCLRKVLVWSRPVHLLPSTANNAICCTAIVPQRHCHKSVSLSVQKLIFFFCRF